LRLVDSCINQLRRKDLLGPLTRVKKKTAGWEGDPAVLESARVPVVDPCDFLEVNPEAKS